MAKYLSSLTLVLFALVPTLIFFAVVYVLGKPVGNIDVGGTWGSYIGLFFLSAIYVAIGIFASSVTKNQIIAFILSVVLCFFFYTGFQYLSSMIPYTPIQSVIISFGITDHYESISRGVIDSRDVIYFFSVIAIFIYASKIVLQSRKWQ
jgi:ABC-2 type transport system permease protein